MTTQPNTDLEYFVEYSPNLNEGEQAQELNKLEFLDLVKQHQMQGIDPHLEYDVFTVFDNGRSGHRLTIRDDYGIFYG